MALNGGPQFKFNEYECNCDRLRRPRKTSTTTGASSPRAASPGRCDWLKDKYGLSPQVVPTGLGEVLGDNDHARAKRAIEAMLRCRSSTSTR